MLLPRLPSTAPCSSAARLLVLCQSRPEPLSLGVCGCNTHFPHSAADETHHAYGSRSQPWLLDAARLAMLFQPFHAGGGPGALGTALGPLSIFAMVGPQPCKCLHMPPAPPITLP